MKITALVDHEVVSPDDPNFESKGSGEPGRMERQVIQALRARGFETEAVPFGPDIRATMNALMEAPPQLVFNMTEHFEGDRRKDSHVAAFLELMHVPFTGTGPEGLMLCRDKATCKRVLGYHRIRVPRFWAVPTDRKRPASRVRFPVIAKPVFEDGSDGISLASIARNDDELADRVRMIHDRMKQPAICEEYIEGRELYVGVIGNDRLTAFPPRELKFGNKEGDGPHIATSKVKWDKEYREKWQIEYTDGELDAPLADRVARASKRIYGLLALRDYARIDLRVTPDNEIVFLEANPNPDLSQDDDLALAARKSGMDYESLIARIVQFAARRHGLSTEG